MRRRSGEGARRCGECARGGRRSARGLPGAGGAARLGGSDAGQRRRAHASGRAAARGDRGRVDRPRGGLGGWACPRRPGPAGRRQPRSGRLRVGDEPVHGPRKHVGRDVPEPVACAVDGDRPRQRVAVAALDGGGRRRSGRGAVPRRSGAARAIALGSAASARDGGSAARDTGGRAAVDVAPGRGRAAVGGAAWACRPVRPPRCASPGAARLRSGGRPVAAARRHVRRPVAAVAHSARAWAGLRSGSRRSDDEHRALQRVRGRRGLPVRRTRLRRDRCASRSTSRRIARVGEVARDARCVAQVGPERRRTCAAPREMRFAATLRRRRADAALSPCCATPPRRR